MRKILIVPDHATVLICCVSMSFKEDVILVQPALNGSVTETLGESGLKKKGTISLLVFYSYLRDVSL